MTYLSIDKLPNDYISIPTPVLKSLYNNLYKSLIVCIKRYIFIFKKIFTLNFRHHLMKDHKSYNASEKL